MEEIKTVSNKLRSQILIDALPYIQKYHNKIVVVKYGGNAMTNDAPQRSRNERYCASH